MSNNYCYAFRGDKCFESMDKHVEGIVRCLRSRWEFSAIKKKLRHIFGVDELLIEDLLITIAILHDIGKTLNGFQKLCRVERCERFPQHYIISARFATTIGVEVGILPQDPEERKKLFNDIINKELQKINEEVLYTVTVVIPILFHHYAQVEEEAFFKDVNVQAFTIDSICSKMYLDLIKSIDSYPQTEVGRKIINAIANTINKHSTIDLLLISLEKDSVLSYTPTFMRGLAEAFVGLLNICDGRVAYINRERCGVE